jgi:hypothetical protein
LGTDPLVSVDKKTLGRLKRCRFGGLANTVGLLLKRI